jgi:hypothetical protein
MAMSEALDFYIDVALLFYSINFVYRVKEEIFVIFFLFPH